MECVAHALQLWHRLVQLGRVQFMVDVAVNLQYFPISNARMRWVSVAKYNIKPVFNAGIV